MRWLLVLAILLPTTLMASYETPDYKVVSAEGPYEVRDYPALTLVSTTMQKSGNDGSFMRLFGFISGRNALGEKISMTTPVLMTGTESGTMSFILPKDVAAKGAPGPANPEVSLRTLPPARYAVFRYSGSTKPTATESAVKKLLVWTASQHLETEGTPLFAYYNPPWTLWFTRRNEVMIRLVTQP